MKVLINTIEELKNYVAVDSNSDIKLFKPFIEQCQEDYILPLLGSAFLEEIQNDYDGALGVVDAMSNANQDVILKIQRALANYAMFEGIPQFGSEIGNLGINVERTDNGEPAPRWKIEKLQLSHLKTADKEADKLLAFLEKNAQPSGDYELWYNSNANTFLTGAIVRNAAIASQFINNGISRRLFLKMKPQIQRIESKRLKKYVCTDQLNELLDQVKNQSLTVNNQLLIDQMAPVVAKMALYQSLPFIQVGISENGITVQSSSDGVVSNAKAGPTEVKALQDTLKKDPTGYEADIDELVQFIDDNISNYPLIANSECYQTTRTSTTMKAYTVDNDISNKHFSV